MPGRPYEGLGERPEGTIPQVLRPESRPAARNDQPGAALSEETLEVAGGYAVGLPAAVTCAPIFSFTSKKETGR